MIKSFCEEPVIIMGDTESMFHQILVPENDRNLLRFLQWDNHDISGAVSDF